MFLIIYFPHTAPFYLLNFLCSPHQYAAWAKRSHRLKGSGPPRAGLGGTPVVVSMLIRIFVVQSSEADGIPCNQHRRRGQMRPNEIL